MKFYMMLCLQFMQTRTKNKLLIHLELSSADYNQKCKNLKKYDMRSLMSTFSHLLKKRLNFRILYLKLCPEIVYQILINQNEIYFQNKKTPAYSQISCVYEGILTLHFYRKKIYINSNYLWGFSILAPNLSIQFFMSKLK